MSVTNPLLKQIPGFINIAADKTAKLFLKEFDTNYKEPTDPGTPTDPGGNGGDGKDTPTLSFTKGVTAYLRMEDNYLVSTYYVQFFLWIIVLVFVLFMIIKAFRLNLDICENNLKYPSFSYFDVKNQNPKTALPTKQDSTKSDKTDKSGNTDKVTKLDKLESTGNDKSKANKYEDKNKEDDDKGEQDDQTQKSNKSDRSHEKANNSKSGLEVDKAKEGKKELDLQQEELELEDDDVEGKQQEIKKTDSKQKANDQRSEDEELQIEIEEPQKGSQPKPVQKELQAAKGKEVSKDKAKDAGKEENKESDDEKKKRIDDMLTQVLILIENIIDKHLPIWIILIILINTMGCYIFTAVFFSFLLIAAFILSEMQVKIKESKNGTLFVEHIFVISLYIAFYIINQEYSNFSFEDKNWQATKY